VLKPAYISYSSDLSESVDGRGGLAESSLRAVPAARVRRSSHHDQSRQNVEENDADPPRHPVSPRSAEVPVDDDDGDDDRDDVHDEREEEVLGDERNADGRRRQDLGDEQQEHDQRQQDRYAHGHLASS